MKHAACIGVIVLLVGVNAYQAFAPHFPTASMLTVVNVSGTPLSNVRMTCGRDQKPAETIGNGMRITHRMEPDDSADVEVSFQCQGVGYSVTGGAMGPRGEARTITILEGGRSAIISYGTSSAVADLELTTKK